MKWFAGIDWAKSHHDVMMIDETGQQAGSLRVAHTKAGIEELKRFLLEIARTPEQLACIVETSLVSRRTLVMPTCWPRLGAVSWQTCASCINHSWWLMPSRPVPASRLMLALASQLVPLVAHIAHYDKESARGQAPCASEAF